jgi:hypothetical protein
MGKDKIIYWVSTGILTLIMLFSVFNYLFNHQAIVGAFESLGYPPYLIYPLAIAKILGLVAVLSRVSDLLKNLAYAGFFFNTLLAFLAHIIAGDGGFAFALIAFLAVIFSFFFERKALKAM